MRTLDAFQQEVLTFLGGRGGIYGDPMGARKTGTTLAWLREANISQRALAVVPGNMFGHWREQAEVDYPWLDVIDYMGTPGKREIIRQDIMGLADENMPIMVLVSYDVMKRDYLRLATMGFDTVVFDEAHRLKGRTTQVAKASERLVKAIPSKVFATGTPVLNHASELWFYLHCLDPKKYSSYWRFCDTYFHIEYRQFRGQGNMTRLVGEAKQWMEKQLQEEIAPYLIQRDIRDLFPDKAWTEEPDYYPVPVEISPTERKQYKLMAKHAWIEGPTGEQITASNALVVNTRLKQLTSDWSMLDSEFGVGSKVKAAAELITDLAEREPVVAFVEYKATGRSVIGRLPQNLRAAMYDGDMSQKDRDAVKASFIAGDLDVLIGTYGSMREGVDGLQHRTNQVVLIDLLWVPGLVDQAVGRVRRDGQERKVQVYVLACEGTIDMTVLRANLRKVNVVKAIRGMSLTDVIYGTNFEINEEAA